MLRIIYAGTPEFAVPALDALLRGEHQVVAVYTQPDRPAGRGRQLKQSPVKRLALAQAVPVCQPQDFNSAADIDLLASHHADLMVVAAYGLLLPGEVLTAPRLGCVNIHASLLPRWRGASPIQQAILAGDKHTGISLMKMDRGLDTGDVISQCRVEIADDCNAAELHDLLAPLGADLLLDSLEDIESALAGARRQDDALATYAPLLSRQQARVDWRKPAAELAREVRAYNPWPVSHTLLEGENLRFWNARVSPRPGSGSPGRVIVHDVDGVHVDCGHGVLQITELQFAGRNRCSAAQALNARDLAGCDFGGDG